MGAPEGFLSFICLQLHRHVPHSRHLAFPCGWVTVRQRRA